MVVLVLIDAKEVSRKPPGSCGSEEMKKKASPFSLSLVWFLLGLLTGNKSYYLLVTQAT